jgi:hypothetical protein
MCLALVLASISITFPARLFVVVVATVAITIHPWKRCRLRDIEKTYTHLLPTNSETQVSAQRAGANLGHQAAWSLPSEPARGLHIRAV